MAQPRITPNKREILYVQDSAGGANASATYLTATSHALDVNVVAGGSAGTQYADGAARGTATGTLMMVDDGTNIQSAVGTSAGVLKVDLSATTANATAVKVDGSAVTQPVSGSVTANAGTNLNTSALALAATQTDKSQFTKLTDGTDTALITGAGELNTIATAQPGVDIGDVTINNASGASAVNIQDGGNSITVDYATTGSGNATGALRVELANNGTGVLATVGAVTAITNALPAGSALIGKVGVDQTTPGTTNAVSLAQLGANTVSTGNGTSGTGVLRVAQVSDGTGVLATVTNVATIGTSVTPGTSAAHLGKAEDAAHTTGDTGVFALGVRNDTLTTAVTSASADYSQFSVDTSGIVMVAGAPRALKGTFQVQLSNTTTETTILSATASTFHDLYGLILANTGATTTKVSIRDDTAGTVRMIIEVPTLETRGFMLPVDSAVPQTAVNKNLTAQCASATTALEVTGFYVSRV